MLIVAAPLLCLLNRPHPLYLHHQVPFPAHRNLLHPLPLLDRELPESVHPAVDGCSSHVEDSAAFGVVLPTASGDLGLDESEAGEEGKIASVCVCERDGLERENVLETKLSQEQRRPSDQLSQVHSIDQKHYDLTASNQPPPNNSSPRELERRPDEDDPEAPHPEGSGVGGHERSREEGSGGEG